MTTSMGTGAAGASLDARDVARFDRLADRWWDPDGPMAPLHAMQPVRLDLMRDQIVAAFGLDPAARRPFTGLRVVDVGCGGGLASEPMARLGATVIGLDPSEQAIAAARAHAAAGGLSIDYRVSSAEAQAEAVAAGVEPAADVALALEIVEHAADRPALIGAVARLVRPGGLVIMTTVNRTAASLLGAKIAAEYVLRWLEPGTHDWRRFPTPDELAADMTAAGLVVVDRVGMTLDPISRRWSRSASDLRINYLMAAERPA